MQLSCRRAPVFDRSGIQASDRLMTELSDHPGPRTSIIVGGPIQLLD
jgi:hypothetical protein